MAMEPQNQVPWVQSIVATLTSVWQAFVVPGALAAWVAYKFKVSRGDTLREREDKRLAEDMAERKRAADRLDAQTMGYIGRLEADNERLRKECDDKDKLIDRWIGLARFWFSNAHDAWHGWAQVATVANLRLKRCGSEELDETKYPPPLPRDLETR